ncbi:glycosyltransferase [Cellulomonas alba]|uniref:Glycosyltransferase n=1 Tax=Cellulomonas alba TaxID=3053467 RepID=A0ABT7SCU6_9CELL|nr:glycosyltransferase [Cellulomonas alba]MDM7854007.1 glycosyltransferase [Cellulomonas alba]
MTDTILAAGPSTATSSVPVVTPVTAVVVTRGRTPYLATTLRALAAQTRRPVRVLLVDAAPVPDAGLGAELAAAFAGVESPLLLSVEAPGARTFGHAVRAALAADDGPATPWVWLLHDDSAPAPTALAELVRAVGRAPSVAVAGAKQRTWTEPERLLEVGVRTSRFGRRMTDVEPGELDQGQHDGRDDVLAVGLAGALVKRDVWDELRGTDPALGPFGDGVDLSRRARLAGYRVVVVPGAVVRHAQASYLGLRGRVAAAADATDPDAVGPQGVDADGDGEDDRADPRRSFVARRRSVLHQRLVGAPLPALPVVGLVALVAAILRACGQLAVKQPGLAVGEMRAALAALLAVPAVVRARVTATRTRRLARRRLRPLQAGLRDVYEQWRDRRLARAASRKVVQAPSELELSELRALATRRRVTLGALAAVLVGVTVVGLGSLVGPAVGGAHLLGTALASASGGLADVWSAATSGWVADGLGARGPADALLTVLALPVAVTGSLAAVVKLLLLGSLVLAGLGAWAAAGAATRSVGVRLWVALAWVAAPALLLALGSGRLGAVLAHAALPWVAFGLARAVGVQRVDQVLSGVSTANHDHEPDVPWFPDDEDEAAPALRRPVALPTPRPPISGSTPRVDEVPLVRVGAPDPTGSVAAAAGAALAFAVVAAAAPALLVPGVLALLVVAVSVPRRRGRVLLVPLPALVLLGPLLASVLHRGSAGWRLLAADPAGLPVASTGSDPVHRLLGLPDNPSVLVPDGIHGLLATAWPLALTAVVLGLAVLALLRGTPAARAVRAAWCVVAVGLAAATASVALPVAVDDGTVVHGWAGPALSLALLGMLAAAAVGADRLVERLARFTFGRRQLAAGLVAAVAMLVPVASLASWAWQARGADAVALHTLDRPVVPAVGQQAQESPDASRVLSLTAQPAAAGDAVVRWQLLRADGPQLADQAAAVATRTLDGGATDVTPAPADPATTEVDGVVARVAGASSGDVAGRLGALAVSDVLVPVAPAGAADAARAARQELVGRLDATAGLARVTDNAAGTLWRVQATADRSGQAAPDVVTSWARLLPGGADVSDAAAPAVAVPASGRSVDATIAPGGADRELVLAERRGSAWHATLDGHALRAVDDGWRQTFAVGAAGGHLQVSYRSPSRTPWLAAQGVVGLVTVLLALPLRRRRAGRS